ncbi:hypothetical protein ZIOFF_075904 [Zingiber officinale]|uniref:Jacalin-type lectin domain-containing protein n=1 Tax=Zingiber officinale TaxID=94328 RepID=A0A8J5C4C7_ZINOF|nr:hypothetical protein ZIOFF_075904 [Zingiber officinale]
MAYCPKFFNCWKVFYDWSTSLIRNPKDEALNAKKQSVVCSIGPCGGTGGGVKDMVPDSKTSILKVAVRHGEVIDGIRILYKTEGFQGWTDWWGGDGGQSYELNLEEDEYFTSIRGHYGYMRRYLVVKSLTFVSNKATYGPYGKEDGTPFTLHAQGGKIVGFFARCGQYLDAIGVYTAY